ncbi:hypothetical protein [Nocardioides perillae]|uniref:Putative membrane protein n=1 Tax=Nocardioides perillae TaxID=1119534 RepID=A0A7Y9RUB7_9ACTN|nr:putative membrane protein [Nocardioides perillae]
MLGKTKKPTATHDETEGAAAPQTRASRTSRPRPSIDVTAAAVRTRVAQLLWLVAVVAALFLAVGALLVALDANEANDLVDFVVSGAGVVDLGIFSREAGEGIFDFSGDNADTKRALVNWGIGAVAWLVVGKLVERVVQP